MLHFVLAHAFLFWVAAPGAGRGENNTRLFVFCVCSSSWLSCGTRKEKKPGNERKHSNGILFRKALQLSPPPTPPIMEHMGKFARVGRQMSAQDVEDTLGYAIEHPCRKSSILVGLHGTPSYHKAHWKRWGGRSPPLFSVGFAVKRAVWTPQIDDFRPGSSIA